MAKKNQKKPPSPIARLLETRPQAVDVREVDPSILFNALGQQGADLKDIGAAAIASGLYPDAETLAEALNGAVTGVKKTHLFLGLTGRGLVNDGVHAGVIAALQARHFAPKSA